jgi:YVTN family beta-propeller protein
VLLLAAVGVTVAIVALTSGGDGAAPVVAPPNSVAVIDPDRNAVVDAVPLGERPTRVSAFGDDVWVLHPDRGTISHVGAGDRALLGTVGVGSAPSNFAAEKRGVWVSDARSGRVTLIEPEHLTVAATARARRRPLPPPRGPFDPDAGGLLAIGFGSLWFASGEQTISRIDPRTGQVTARIRPVSTGESNGGIGVGAGSVWVAGPFQESPLSRIDPARNIVVSRIPLSKFRSGGVAVAGGSVWVADPGGDKVWRVDPLRNIPVATTQVGLAPLGVAAGHGSIWVANSGDGTVSRIDPVSGRVVRTIAVGGSPNSLAVTDDAVWVTVS